MIGYGCKLHLQLSTWYFFPLPGCISTQGYEIDRLVCKTIVLYTIIQGFPRIQKPWFIALCTNRYYFHDHRAFCIILQSSGIAHQPLAQERAVCHLFTGWARLYQRAHIILLKELLAVDQNERNVLQDQPLALASNKDDMIKTHGHASSSYV